MVKRQHIPRPPSLNRPFKAHKRSYTPHLNLLFFCIQPHVKRFQSGEWELGQSSSWSSFCISMTKWGNFRLGDWHLKMEPFSNLKCTYFGLASLYALQTSHGVWITSLNTILTKLVKKRNIWGRCHLWTTPLRSYAPHLNLLLFSAPCWKISKRRNSIEVVAILE